MLTPVATLGLAVSFVIAPMAEDPCKQGITWAGCTSGTIEDDNVVLRAEDSGHVPAENPTGGALADTLAPDESESASDYGPDRDDYVVVAVTLADIARFRPTPAVQVMEPNGWAVVGLPINVYAHAEPQIVAGTLLGESADVRFTPVGFRWSYGDGSSATSRSPGATWGHLGLREFDATSTSHTYRRAGDHTIRLTVTYRAEYRIGGGDFVRIPGTLTLPANDLRVTVRPAKTVLVDRNCTRSSVGPGC